MAKVQVPPVLGHSGGREREEISGSSKDNIYKTMAVISTAINELSRTIHQISEQLNGFPTAGTGNPGLPKSSNHVDHFEIFAIAMKEVQSKSSRIEQLEQENRVLRDRLGNRERAGERSERISPVACQQAVNLNEHGERFVPSDAPNSNGKRSLIALPSELNVHENNCMIPASTNATNGEADPSPNLSKDMGLDDPIAEIEEIPESSNGQINGDILSQDGRPAVNHETTLSEQAAEKPTTRQNPARRQRAVRQESVLEQATRNETRSTRARLVSQNVRSKKAEGRVSLRKDKPTGSGDEEEDSTELEDREGAAVARNETTEDRRTSPLVASEPGFRPARQLIKRRRGRPKVAACEHPQIATVTSSSPAPSAGKPGVSNSNIKISENTKDALDAKKAEEEAEKRRKAEIAARELLVQAAMQREETYML